MKCGTSLPDMVLLRKLKLSRTVEGSAKGEFGRVGAKVLQNWVPIYFILLFIYFFCVTCLSFFIL